MTYLYILSFSYVFASLSGIPQWFAFVVLDRKNRSFKPFTCAACLSFWISLIVVCLEYNGYYGLTRFIDFIGVPFVLFVLAGVIETILRKLI